MLALTQPSYHGREGVRDYFRDLQARDRGQHVQVSEIRRIGADEFVVFAELLIREEVISPAAVIIRVKDGEIVRASGYLSDEATMTSVGLIPARE